MTEAGLLEVLVKMNFLEGFLLATVLFALVALVLLAARHAETRLDMELERERLEERLRDLEREQDAGKERET